MKKDFDTDFLLTNVTHFQVTFIEYGQTVNEHDISVLGKMQRVYVTDVVDIDKGQ